jgi:hypothetical protein
MLYAARVAAILFVALALVPAGAHFSAMFNKLRLNADQYLASQRAYDGWSLFGIVAAGALLSTLWLTIALYRRGEAWSVAALAFGLVVASHALFWIFTLPANKATDNWTKLPGNWTALRLQWEYSHAAAAVLDFLALVLLVFAAVRR